MNYWLSVLFVFIIIMLLFCHDINMRCMFCWRSCHAISAPCVAGVGTNSVIPVEPNGRTKRQHVTALCGMSGTFCMIILMKSPMTTTTPIMIATEKMMSMVILMILLRVISIYRVTVGPSIGSLLASGVVNRVFGRC